MKKIQKCTSLNTYAHTQTKDLKKFSSLLLQMNTLKSALEGVEKERDYYFSKLREVELLCQEQGEENAPFVDRLMEVLYASDDQVSL